MRAATAKKLRIGDAIRTAFSNSIREATIVSIRWPHFECRTVLASGVTRTEIRRYKSLYPLDGKLDKSR